MRPSVGCGEAGSALKGDDMGSTVFWCENIFHIAMFERVDAVRFHTAPYRQRAHEAHGQQKIEGET